MHTEDRPSPSPDIETFVLGEYQTNCFIVTVPGGPEPDECWIVDCGFEPAPLLATIDSRSLKPSAIVLTHTHPDHIAGVDEALGRYGPIPLWLSEAERGFCSDPMKNLSALLGVPVTCREPDHWLRDGDELTLGPVRWRAVHAPGHSPGGMLFIHDASRQAIVGDTLFAGSIGRVDFPGSDPAAMERTLNKVMMKLPDDMTIHPGHGPSTTIGAERRSNPFIGRRLGGAW